MKRVVCFGELLLRLSPPGDERLFQSPHLRTWFGGSEANVAAGIAHLGGRSSYITRLPMNAVGDAALASMRAEGVCVDGILWGGDRMGIYFVEPGADLRPMRVVYDRAGSGFAALDPAELDWPALLEGAGWLHLSGITPALGDGPAQAAIDAAEAARALGVRVSVDLNYRPALWARRDPKTVIPHLVRDCDLLVGNPGAAAAMLGVASSGDPHDADFVRCTAQRIAAEHGCRAVAITLRDVVSASEHHWSAALWDGAAMHASRRWTVRVVDRVGGGDSFAAALIHALQGGRDAAAAVEFATAASAFKLTIPGDFNRVSTAEVDRLLESPTACGCLMASSPPHAPEIAAADAPSAVASPSAELVYPRFGYRWTICALLFAATTINYVDRQVLGLLAPVLQGELGWSETQYGDIVSWFSFAYAIGFLGMGRLLDRVGVRRGYAISIVAWSLAAMGHAWARSVGAFSLARGALGLGESGNFPAAIKATAEWFPRRERALATGIFNAGSNVGAVLAPILVPAVMAIWGWPAVFLVTGALGFVWLAAWLALYRSPEQHPSVSAAELAHIRSDPAERTEHIPWLSLLRHRQTWAFFLAKGLTDPIWWFYLYWLPKFLDARWGIKLAAAALPLVAIYLVADVGSVFGGWLSSTLIRRGWTVNRARKTALLIAALLIVPTMLAPRANSLWVAVAIVSVAAAAHQWWSCNLFTTASDMFPRRAVASVVGIGGFAGAMGGVLFQRATGRILEATGHDYAIIFTICGSAYVVAWLVMHALVPRLQPARLDADS